MEFKADTKVIEEEVKTIVKKHVRTYTLTLNEEEADLMLVLTGSLTGSRVKADDPNGWSAFKLSISGPRGGAYPSREMACNPDELRSKLANKVWEALNAARNADLNVKE